MYWKKKGLLNNESLVLYQIENKSELDIKYGSNSDVEEFSFFPEKEILFFPFSCFEVNGNIKKEKNKEIEIKEKNIKKINENFYIITLSYLGRYSKSITKKGKVPETSFAKNMLKTEVLDKLKMNDSKTIQFDFNFEKYITEETKKKLY